MKYEYAKNRISKAIFVLCTAPGDVRSRLLEANEVTSALNDNHFPDELLPLWRDIHEMLTKHGPATNFEGKMWDGAISNTLRKIRNSTGTKIAKKLYELHEEFQSKY